MKLLKVFASFKVVFKERRAIFCVSQCC